MEALSILWSSCHDVYVRTKEGTAERRPHDETRRVWAARFQDGEAPTHHQSGQQSDSACFGPPALESLNLKDEMTLKSRGPIPLYYESLYGI